MIQNLTDHDIEALRAIPKVHVKTALARDWAGWVATCTDDVVLMPPDHEPVRGRDTAEAWFEGFPPIKDFNVEVESVEGTGDLAFMRGTAPMSIEQDGRQIDLSFKWLATFRKQADGSWKMAADMWSPNHPVSE